MGKPAKTQEKRQKWEMLKSYCDELQNKIHQCNFLPNHRIAHNPQQIQLFESLGLRPPNTVRAFERFYENFIQKCSVLQPRRGQREGRRRGRERYMNNGRSRHSEYGGGRNNHKRHYVAVGSGVVHGRTPYEVVPSGPSGGVYHLDRTNGPSSVSSPSQVHGTGRFPATTPIGSPPHAHLGVPPPSKHPRPSPRQQQIENANNAKLQKNPLSLGHDQTIENVQPIQQQPGIIGGVASVHQPVMHLNGAPMSLTSQSAGSVPTMPMLIQDSQGFLSMQTQPRVFQYGATPDPQFLYANPTGMGTIHPQAYPPHPHAHIGYPIPGCVCPYCQLLAGRGIPSIGMVSNSSVGNMPTSTKVSTQPTPTITVVPPRPSPSHPQPLATPPQPNPAHFLTTHQQSNLPTQHLDPALLLRTARISSRSILSSGNSSTGPDPANLTFVPHNMHFPGDSASHANTDSVPPEDSPSHHLNVNAKSYRPPPDVSHNIPATNVQSLAHSRSRGKRSSRAKKSLKSFKENGDARALDHIQEDQSSRRSLKSTPSSHSSKKKWQVKSGPSQELVVENQSKPSSTDLEEQDSRPKARERSLSIESSPVQELSDHGSREANGSQSEDSQHSSGSFSTGSMTDEMEEDKTRFTFVEDDDEGSSLSYPDIPDEIRNISLCLGIGRKKRSKKHRKRKSSARKIKSSSAILTTEIKEEETPVVSNPNEVQNRDSLEDIERDLNALKNYWGTASVQGGASSGGGSRGDVAEDGGSTGLPPLSPTIPRQLVVSKSLPTVLHEDDDESDVDLVPDDMSESVATASSFEDDRTDKKVVDDVDEFDENGVDDGEGDNPDLMNIGLDEITQFLKSTVQSPKMTKLKKNIVIGILYHNSHQGNMLKKLLLEHSNVKVVHLQYEFDANQFVRDVHKQRIDNLFVCEPDNVAAFGLSTSRSMDDEKFGGLVSSGDNEQEYRDYVSKLSNILHMMDAPCPLNSVILVARRDRKERMFVEGENSTNCSNKACHYREFSLQYLSNIGQYFCDKAGTDWKIMSLSTGFVGGCESVQEFAMKSDVDSLEVLVSELLTTHDTRM